MSKNLSALSFRKGLEKNLFEKMVESSDKTGTAVSDDLKSVMRLHWGPYRSMIF